MAEFTPNNNEQFNEGGNKPEAAKKLDASKKGINLFFGERERKLWLNMGTEISNKMLQETFLLYRIDKRTTEVHEFYGESKNKNYLPEVEIFGRLNVETDSPEYLVKAGIIRQGQGILTANVYLHHLDELQVEVNMGDFIYFKGNFYEIYDDGKSNIGNKYAFGADKYFYIKIEGREVNSDVFDGK